MIYLTYSDPATGVYSSQVCDVIRYLNKAHHARIRLVAFVSVRGFLRTRKKIRSEIGDAVVLPMLPKMNLWKPSVLFFFLACIFLRERTALARGVLACVIALRAARWRRLRLVGYDGRGAIAAEWREYEVAAFENIKRSIHRLEAEAVTGSSYRIAVSNGLVEYWKREFAYDGSGHVVIPCTLNSHFAWNLPEEAGIRHTRESLGAAPDDVVLVYSGSVSGWQSFGLVASFARPLLKAHSNLHLLFLSGASEQIDSLVREFPGQVTRRWVAHREIRQTLAACDYGLLIREDKVTNRVAAPTKFAEYLNAGLRVLISENVGDYSAFVREHGCGTVLHGDLKFDPVKPTRDDKMKCIRLAKARFTKEAHAADYIRLLDAMNREK